MRNANHEHVLELAKHFPCAISDCVEAATYDGAINPKLLQAALQEAGYNGTFNSYENVNKDGSKNPRLELTITNADGVTVMFSNSVSQEECLLHAVLGFFRDSNTLKRNVEEHHVERLAKESRELEALKLAAEPAS